MLPSFSGPVGSLAVLMPTFNGAAFLDRIMASLAAQRVALPWRFLAIDSGSTDDTLGILKDWRPRFPVELRVLHIHPSAFDHGDTRNLLAAESSGDLLVFLTQDAIPRNTDWLARLAANFDDPTVGAAYCRNVPRPDAQLLTRAFSQYDPGYAAGRRVQRLETGHEPAAMSPEERRLLFNLNNVAAAYRRDLWERHPFPRTEFGEDILMARALIEAGYSVVYDDQTIVEHSHDYDPDAMRARAIIDGRFNAEWLGRICVSSRRAARILTKRQIERDRAALEAAGVTGSELTRQLRYAKRLRRAAFMGLHEGGRSRARHPTTRMRSRTSLRILYVVHGFPPDTWAGTEVYTLGLARLMQERGHEVAVLTRAPAAQSRDAGGPADFSLHQTEFEGLQVWRLINRLLPPRLRATYSEPRAEAAFRELVLRLKPDVVHFQHLIHLSATLPRIARELGVPALFTANDYWTLCARVQLIRPDGVRCEANQGYGCLLCVTDRKFAAIPAARRLLPLLSPVLKAIASGPRLPGLQRLGELAGQARDMGDRLAHICDALDACDLIIAPSRFMRQKLLETGRFRAHSVVYSDYGTATAHGEEVAPARESSGKVRFGFIGSLLWYKGVDVLIDAMRQLDCAGAQLHIFGEFRPSEDAYHARLAALAEACGGRVHFHGRFENDRVGDVYRDIDVLVVPSVWFENSPVTIHEAFLLRRPVVTSDIGGMAELVRDGFNGLHFAVGDAHDLAVKLRRFCDEPDLLRRLSDSPRIKTMAEDAREMEVRYRRLACIVRDTSRSVLLDRAGWDACRRGGAAEQQGTGLALLRPGGWIEFDVSHLPAGSVEIRLVLQTLAGESSVRLGGTVFLDDVEIGEISPFTAGAQNELHTVSLRADLSAPPKRLRITTRLQGEGLFLRVARVTIADGSSSPDAESGDQLTERSMAT